MNLARRVEELPPYLFAEISRKIAAKRAEGVDVISLRHRRPRPADAAAHHRRARRGRARPGEPPLSRRAEGLPELRDAPSPRWYERRFGVTLRPRARRCCR